MVQQNSAKDCGPSLIVACFLALPFASIIFLPGDVVVFQEMDSHPHGQIVMYCSNQWISDWKQAHFAPGPSYNHHLVYTIYRYTKQW
jgi:hypothetical protein